MENDASSKPAQSRPENAFKPDLTDFLFALAAFVLGYLFSRWVFFSWQGWGVAVFTAAFLLAAVAYLMKKGAFANSVAAWFWLVVTLAAGASYALWENKGFGEIRGLFLFCSAVYFVIVASGRTIMGKTGNYLLADGVNAVILVPFRNLINQYVSFSALWKGARRGRGLPILLGVLLAAILLAILIPMLKRADSGGFGMILAVFADFLKFIDDSFMQYALFAIPVASYLYGLISGVAHKKGTGIIKPEAVGKTVAGMRFLHPATIFIALGTVCALYLVFILSQTPYFFSAFSGVRPEGWLIYSEYARQGFFELCGIAAINLVVLTIGNVTCKKHRASLRALKALNIALAAITLVLIATAASKMALYIGAYGLTMPRLLPCLFMLFLAVVFVALIAMQKWEFSIVRFALVVGSVMLCVLCLSNPDALVARYNTDRYVSGTLAEYDTAILYRAGSAGVQPALEVYNATDDPQVKHDILIYLMHQHRIGAARETHQTSLESSKAKEALTATGLIWD